MRFLSQSDGYSSTVGRVTEIVFFENQYLKHLSMKHWIFLICLLNTRALNLGAGSGLLVAMVMQPCDSINQSWDVPRMTPIAGVINKLELHITFLNNHRLVLFPSPPTQRTQSSPPPPPPRARAFELEGIFFLMISAICVCASNRNDCLDWQCVLLLCISLLQMQFSARCVAVPGSVAVHVFVWFRDWHKFERACRFPAGPTSSCK